MAEPQYADWEHLAVRIDTNKRQAWMYNERTKRWELMEYIEAFANAGLMSKKRFMQKFPNLPPLPPEAFK